MDDGPTILKIADRQPHQAYRSAVLFFGGLGQSREIANGIFALQDAAYRAYAPDCWVQYFPWLDDVVALARLVEGMAEACQRVHGVPLQVGVLGYSFGGETAVQFCRELAHPTMELVLCDAVSRWKGRVGWSKALVKATIWLPPNVERCRGVRQENPRFRLEPPFFFPSGHDVQAESPSRTLLEPFAVLPDEHVDIESTRAFRLLAVDAVWRVTSQLDTMEAA